MDWLPAPEREGISLQRPATPIEGVRFRDARRRFIASRRGDVTTHMANSLTEGVLRRFLSRETVEQFSKWCTPWHGESNFAGSASAAQHLSEVLFGEVVPRMRDNHNQRVENADELWAAFCGRLAARPAHPYRS